MPGGTSCWASALGLVPARPVSEQCSAARRCRGRRVQKCKSHSEVFQPLRRLQLPRKWPVLNLLVTSVVLVGPLTSHLFPSRSPTRCASVPTDSLPDEDLDTAGPHISVTTGLSRLCLPRQTRHPSSGPGRGGAWNSSWGACILKGTRVCYSR